MSQKFIQVLNVSVKHWILVFRGHFGQVSICNCLVTDGKYPKKVIKSISRIASCHGSLLELRILPNQQRKSSIDCGMFAIADAVENLHGENVENWSFNVTLTCNHLLVCLQLEKYSHFQRPIKDICRHVCDL